ncbi:MAG: hypothetical protein MHM6MM_000078 [Cercozoa sp. M6MM]
MGNEHPEWVQQQIRAFGGWANMWLSAGGHDCQITTFTTEMQDGVVLARLLESLEGRKQLFKVHEKPKLVFQRNENISAALHFIQQRTKFELVGISPTAIEQAQLKPALALTWILILFYQIERSSSRKEQQQDGENQSSGQSAKSALLEWVALYIDVDALPVRNFDSHWQDGRAFLQLILALLDCVGIEANVTTSEEPKERLTTSFALALEHLNVPAILDTDLLLSSVPDELSVMTYIAMLRHGLQQHGGDDSAERELEQERHRAKLSELREKLRIVRSENAALRVAVTDVQASTKLQLRTVSAQVSQVVSRLQTQVARQTVRIQANETAAAQLETKLTQNELAKQQLAQQVQQLESSLQQTREQLSHSVHVSQVQAKTHEQNCAQLESQIAALNEELASARRQGAEQSENASQLSETLESERAKAASQLAELEARLNEAREIATRESNARESESAKLATQLSQLETELTAARDKIERQTRHHEALNQSHQQEREASARTLADLETRLSEAETRADETKRSFQEALESHGRRHFENSNRVAELEAELAAARFDLTQQSETAASKVSSLQQQLFEAEVELKQQQERAQVARDESLQQQQQLQAQVARLYTALEQSESSVRKLKQAVCEGDNKAASLESQLKALRERAEAAKLESTQRDEQATQSQAKFESRIAELEARLEAQSRDTAAEATRLRLQHDAQLERALAQTHSQNERLTQAQQQVTQAQQRVAQLQQENVSRTREALEAASRAAELERLMRQQQQELRRAKDDLEWKVSEIESHKDAVAQNEKETANLVAQMRKHIVKRRTVEQQMSQLRQQLSLLTERERAHQAQMSTANSRIAELEAQLQGMTSSTATPEPKRAPAVPTRDVRDDVSDTASVWSDASFSRTLTPLTPPVRLSRSSLHKNRHMRKPSLSIHSVAALTDALGEDEWPDEAEVNGTSTGTPSKSAPVSINEQVASFERARDGQSLVPLELVPQHDQSKTSEKRVSYRFGTRIVHVELLSDKLCVRIGGGYMPLSEFVSKYEASEARKIYGNTPRSGPASGNLRRFRQNVSVRKRPPRAHRSDDAWP